MILQIYVKIKSSWIKAFLQYSNHYKAEILLDVMLHHNQPINQL